MIALTAALASVVTSIIWSFLSSLKGAPPNSLGRVSFGLSLNISPKTGLVKAGGSFFRMAAGLNPLTAPQVVYSALMRT